MTTVAINSRKDMLLYLIKNGGNCLGLAGCSGCYLRDDVATDDGVRCEVTKGTRKHDDNYREAAIAIYIRDFGKEDLTAALL